MFLDWLFPRRRIEDRIEKMSAADFKKETKKYSAKRQIGRARPGRFPLENLLVRALFSYRQPLVARAIWELKYRGSPRVARLFAELIVIEFLAAGSFDHQKPLILIPLPNSAERRRERGWNQTELVAKEIENYIKENKNGRAWEKVWGGISIRNDIFRKTRHTKTQAGLSRRERLENLAGCFSVNRATEALAVLAANASGENQIILFDDVVTTGTTLTEAARVLRIAGAKNISALTLARAD